MHSIVCGRTGNGKSSTILIPNPIERTGTSAIVTEATAGSDDPDLFAKTAAKGNTWALLVSGSGLALMVCACCS